MLEQIAATAPAMRNFSFLILQIETRAQLCKKNLGQTRSSRGGKRKVSSIGSAKYLRFRHTRYYDNLTEPENLPNRWTTTDNTMNRTQLDKLYLARSFQNHPKSIFFPIAHTPNRRTSKPAVHSRAESDAHRKFRPCHRAEPSRANLGLSAPPTNEQLFRTSQRGEKKNAQDAVTNGG